MFSSGKDHWFVSFYSYVPPPFGPEYPHDSMFPSCPSALLAHILGYNSGNSLPFSLIFLLSERSHLNLDFEPPLFLIGQSNPIPIHILWYNMVLHINLIISSYPMGHFISFMDHLISLVNGFLFNHKPSYLTLLFFTNWVHHEVLRMNQADNMFLPLDHWLYVSSILYVLARDSLEPPPFHGYLPCTAMHGRGYWGGGGCYSVRLVMVNPVFVYSGWIDINETFLLI
jgi:hypothetical protein